MKKKILVILSYIIFFFNSNVLTSEKNNILKVGLLAPLSGKYAELGNSLLYSLQLALAEINDKNIFIIPKDAGFNDKNKLETAIKEIKSEGANVIIGPISNNEFGIVKKFNNTIFFGK